MPELTLLAAIREANDARDRGLGAVVVQAVGDRSGRGISLTARMVVLSDGTALGSFHPALDDAVIGTAMDCLSERRSRVRSFEMRLHSAQLVGTQGGNIDFFFEVLARPPRLIIAGAGHIAQPLATIASMVEFDVTVLDDRAEFASRERFPTARTLLVGPYRETIGQLEIDDDTYIVLVTRGHVHDTACLEVVLPSPTPYIGMIGSKRRVRTVLDHVRAGGAEPAALKRIYAPVGLDIGARTPGEIALAIMAEIVRVRRGGTGASLALREPPRG